MITMQGNFTVLSDELWREVREALNARAPVAMPVQVIFTYLGDELWRGLLHAVPRRGDTVLFKVYGQSSTGSLWRVADVRWQIDPSTAGQVKAEEQIVHVHLEELE